MTGHGGPPNARPVNGSRRAARPADTGVSGSPRPAASRSSPRPADSSVGRRQACAGRPGQVLDPAAGAAADRGGVPRARLAAEVAVPAAVRQRRRVIELDWRDGRQYVAACYTDTVPLYGIERLTSPTRCRTGTPGSSRPGTPSEQVRYMEYPVLTGFFQWANARLTECMVVRAARSKGAAGGGLLRHHRVLAGAGLAGGGLGDVPAAQRHRVERPWDAALVAASPLVLVQCSPTTTRWR